MTLIPLWLKFFSGFLMSPLQRPKPCAVWPPTTLLLTFLSPPSLLCSHTLHALLFFKPNNHSFILAPSLSVRLASWIHTEIILHVLQVDYSSGILSEMFSPTILSKNQPPISMLCTVFFLSLTAFIWLTISIVYVFVCMLIHLPLLISKLNVAHHYSPLFKRVHESCSSAQIQGGQKQFYTFSYRK